MEINTCPKQIALNGIKRRVVTLDKAKEDFKNWINEGLSRGGFSDDVIDYWRKVKKEIDKIKTID